VPRLRRYCRFRFRGLHPRSPASLVIAITTRRGIVVRYLGGLRCRVDYTLQPPRPARPVARLNLIAFSTMRHSATKCGCVLLMRAAVASSRLSAIRIRVGFPRARAGPRVSVSMSCSMHALSNAFIGWTRSRRRRVTFVPGPHQLYPGRCRSPRSYGGTYRANSTTNAWGIVCQPLKDTE
jgi:hypothetical protein